MRIIGGLYRHRNIVFPSSETTRPTKDRIRESIFNSLGFDVQGSNVLDLFAGSGAYGLEAVSRGAKECTFVDKEKEPIKCINRNLKDLGITCGTVLNLDYEEFLKRYNGKPFDIVLLDPPYAMEVCNDIVNYILNKDIVTKDAIIVVETDKEFIIDESLFSKVKRFKYGFIYVTILRR